MSDQSHSFRYVNNVASRKSIATFLEEISRNTKAYNFLLLQMMLLAFSIAFGSDYGKSILPIMFVTWFFVVTKEDLKCVLRHKVVVAFMLFIGIHLISLLWSADVVDGARYISRMVRYIFIPLIIYASAVTESSVKYILGAFIFGMFTNEIISYLIYFDLYDTAYSESRYYPIGFINRIPYSVLVAFTAILILFQAKHADNVFIKCLYAFFFMTMTANLVISSGRTGYVVFFGSLSVLIFSYYRLSFRNLLELLIFPAVIFGLAYSLDDAVQARVKSSVQAIDKINVSQDYDTSIGARIAMYSVAQEILDQKENSIIYGAGTGGIYEMMKSSLERTGILKESYDHLHNSYLMAYVYTGIIGLVLLSIIFYLIWKVPVKDKERLFLKQLLVLTVVISTFGDVMISIKETMLFFGIFVGLILVNDSSQRFRTGR